MAELARQIIRQQWSKRHDRDPAVRNRAISLIKTHVVMLRQWTSDTRHASRNSASRLFEFRG